MVSPLSHQSTSAFETTTRSNLHLFRLQQLWSNTPWRIRWPEACSAIDRLRPKPPRPRLTARLLYTNLPELLPRAARPSSPFAWSRPSPVTLTSAVWRPCASSRWSRRGFGPKPDVWELLKLTLKLEEVKAISTAGRANFEGNRISNGRSTHALLSHTPNLKKRTTFSFRST